MADQNGPPSPPPNHRRRSSIVEMFQPRVSSNNNTTMSSSPPSAAIPPNPGVPQHRKGNSITSLGLTTNPTNQSSPYDAFARQRRASIATSSSSGSPDFRNSFGDEPAVLEEDDQTRATIQPPSSPSFARRVSFGAQALKDVRLGGSPGATGGGRRPSSSLFTLDEKSENATPSRRAASGTAKTAGEGFNWSSAIRDRSKRSPSFSSGNPFASNSARPRSASNSNPDPPKEMTKPIEVPKLKKPDHLGERMLRGDFMMD